MYSLTDVAYLEEKECNSNRVPAYDFRYCVEDSICPASPMSPSKEREKRVEIWYGKVCLQQTNFKMIVLRHEYVLWLHVPMNNVRSMNCHKAKNKIQDHRPELLKQETEKENGNMSSSLNKANQQE
jgi:hypothetical protein